MQYLWEYLKTVKKPILLYGTGNGADKIIDRLLLYGVTVSGVFASDGFVRNRYFRGFKVISYSESKAVFKNFIVLVAFGSKRPEVLNNVEKIAFEQELYVVDVPVFGEMFPWTARRYFFVISLKNCKNPSAGGTTPILAATGSTIIAATSSPYLSISSLTESLSL